MFDSLVSDLNLFSLYPNIWTPRNLWEAAVNRLTGRPAPFPLSVNMVITNVCNLSCKMCFCSESLMNGDKILSTGQILNFIQEIKAHGPVIHFGGGEPFSRPDFLEILAKTKESALKCLVTTNGSLLTPSIISQLRRIAPEVVIFSLYGPQKIHDEVTQREGAYKKSVENLRGLLKAKNPKTRVIVSSIVLPQNLPFFDAFLEELKPLPIQGLKIEHLNFVTRQEYDSQINKCSGKFDLRPADLIREIFDRNFTDQLNLLSKKIRKNFPKARFKPALNAKEARSWYGSLDKAPGKCSFISHSVFINYNGDIMPCQFLVYCSLGNIQKDSLEEVWKKGIFFQLRKEIKERKPAACKRCCKL